MILGTRRVCDDRRFIFWSLGYMRSVEYSESMGLRLQRA